MSLFLFQDNFSDNFSFRNRIFNFVRRYVLVVSCVYSIKFDTFLLSYNLQDWKSLIEPSVTVSHSIQIM